MESKPVCWSSFTNDLIKQKVCLENNISKEKVSFQEFVMVIMSLASSAKRGGQA